MVEEIDLTHLTENATANLAAPILCDSSTVQEREKSTLNRGLFCLLLTALVCGSIWAIGNSTSSSARNEWEVFGQKNDSEAREAFTSVASVFKHPRCLNCHVPDDFPRQGDDSHRHAQNVKRGTDGHGLYGEKCIACHQTYNVAGLSMPPGAPNWRLPPANMPMNWMNKSPGQICRQLKDPKQNGGRTVAQIVEHVTSDKLVMWGWNPGEGRSVPPISHEEFARKIAEWARYGAACPE